MKASIEKENLDIIKVIPVLAEDMDFDEEYVARAYGIDTLISVMAQVLPAELQHAFMHVQKGNLELKRKMSHACVATAVATAFGEGFAPVPFADAAMLVPTQVGMIAGITTIYGYNINKTVLTAFVSSTIGTAGATVLGKNIVSNILKLIPGVGTVAGGAISGTTAGLITTALGEAYIAIMTMMYKGELKESDLNIKKEKLL